MRKKKLELFAALIWFFCTFCWGGMLCADFILGLTKEYLIVLHGLTFVMSLAAAVVNLMRYRRDRDETDSQDGF